VPGERGDPEGGAGGAGPIDDDHLGTDEKAVELVLISLPARG
jgi:hypothetical protein